MHRFDGTAARQLDLIDLDATPVPSRPTARPTTPAVVRPNVRLLRRDVYAELDRRRRRAQIAARRWTEE